MDNLLVVIITSGFAGVVATKLFDYLTAKLSARTKQDKMADLIQTYISIHKMSVGELEKTLNQVWVTTNENITLKRDLSEIQSKREERDEQFEAMAAKVKALETQVDKDARDREQMRKKLSQYEVNNRALWKYALALLEQMKRHRIIPADPPEELETDPEIMKIIKEIKDKGGK